MGAEVEMAPAGRRVLIVGATSAIASEAAREYARRGARLFLVARDARALAALADELAPHVAGARSGDFLDHAAAGAHVAAAIDALGALDVALVAHGWLPDQPATERDPALAMRAIDVNFLSAVAFLIPVANHMEARGAGRIAVMTSVAGERGRPRNYTYGAAKRATSTYLEGLRSRLWRAGVRVTDLRLGPVDTPMTADHPKNALFGAPGPVGRACVAAIERGRRVAYLPRVWRAIMPAVRWLPEPLFQRFAFLSGR
ncbi:MAG: SDR family NAD(P)-dependent oxidoreductase [Myxococcota bacterium]